MQKFKVGDRVVTFRKGSRFVREGDTGTVTQVDDDGTFWALWDNPLQPHVDGIGWCVHAHACALTSTPRQRAARSFLSRLAFWRKAA